MLAQSDPALLAFDRLRVREVREEYGHSASSFLAMFQSTAASLEPDERIKLEVVYADMELLKAVLADPQASKICLLDWSYGGEEDVGSIIPLLTNNCPELGSLQVSFSRHSAFDFVSSVLEHPGNKIKVLEMPEYTKGNIPRFFAALGQSQVSALTLLSDGTPEFELGLSRYLAKDLLVRLKAWQLSFEMIVSLAKCTRLAELKMWQCNFSQPTALTHLPKSVTKLVLHGCTFAGDFDWSFLADSNVRVLGFENVRGVDKHQLGGALAVYLRAKGLDELRFDLCYFVGETLVAVGVELGRVKRLNLEDSDLNDASIAMIALALQAPNSEMKELVLKYIWSTRSSIENHLVPALRHPNCHLAKLNFWTDPTYDAAAKQVQGRFYHRRALFVLLQGQQERKLYCSLRRLPAEMFRMVGKVLV